MLVKLLNPGCRKNIEYSSQYPVILNSRISDGSEEDSGEPNDVVVKYCDNIDEVKVTIVFIFCENISI